MPASSKLTAMERAIVDDLMTPLVPKAGTQKKKNPRKHDRVHSYLNTVGCKQPWHDRLCDRDARKQN